MAPRKMCGAITKKGTPCRWAAGECPVHGSRVAVAPDAGPPAAPLAHETTAVGERDLRGLGWWLIGEVLNGGLDAARASVVSSVMRVLANLGPAPLDEEAALRESAFRGRLMNGFRPQTEEEWELVSRYLDEDALAEMRRWPPLFEDDGGNREQPLVPRDGGAREVEVAVFGDVEHGA